MGNYMLFCGLYYYPNGGQDDFLGRFDTYEEALAGFKNNTLPNSIDWWECYDWWQIYDIDNDEWFSGPVKKE